MKRHLLLVTLLFVSGLALNAQQVDSIYFHLYTDSLKKGTYNYINVDAKLTNGKWQPLTSKEIRFSSSACSFSGNELIVPADFGADKVTVRAVLISKPSIWIERDIWIKRNPDPVLPTKDEDSTPSRKRRRGG